MERPLRILHLEDDPLDAELVKSRLEEDGVPCDIMRVDNRADFAKLLDGCVFDVILADYSLPSFDGVAALGIVLEKHPDIPYIFVSGRMGEDVAVEALKHGATDYVLKTGLTRLAPAVKRALKEAEEHSELRRADNNVRKLNRVYAVLSAVNRLIIRARDPKELFEGSCRIAVEEGLFLMSWVGLVDEASGVVRPVACTGCEQDYLKEIRITTDDGPEGMGPTGRTVKTGRHFVNNDTENKPVMLPWRDEAMMRGYRSSASFPLLSEGRTIGAFTVYAAESNFFDDEEVRLLDDLAADISHALWSIEQEGLRRRAEDALRQAGVYNRSLIEAALDPLVTIGADGRITDVNAATEAITGRTRDELVGTDFTGYFTDPEKAEAGYQKAFNEGMVLDYELEIRHKFGQSTPVLYNASVYKNEEGRIIGVFAAARDITERKRMEDERRKVDAEVQQMQKLESLRVLAGGIAHDLNNLMVAVTANAELALMHLTKESPAWELIGAIGGATSRIKNLSKQIMNYSGKGTAQKRPIDLSDIVDETTRLLRASVSKNAHIEYDPTPDLPYIEADQQNVQQIIMNLVINASDAMGDTRGAIKVRTGTVDATRAYLDEVYLGRGLPEKRYVYVEVSDTGQGMTPETMKRIFEPFYTTKTTGRGLGLSAVFGIVREHEGALEIDSEPGRGTTFRVLLPSMEMLYTGEAEKPADPGIWKGSGTVLIVDDVESALSMTKKVVETAGYTALTASDGKSGVDLYRENAGRVDAVIIDLVMPGMRGDQAVREMRDIHPDVRVMLLSGYHELDLKELLAGPGRMVVVEKPYKVNYLLEKLKEMLR